MTKEDKETPRTRRARRREGQAPGATGAGADAPAEPSATAAAVETKGAPSEAPAGSSRPAKDAARADEAEDDDDREADGAEDDEAEGDDEEAEGDDEEAAGDDDEVAPNRHARRRAAALARQGITETSDDRRERLRARGREDRERSSAARRARQKERAQLAADGLDAGERMDDAFTRFTHGSLKWLRDNSMLVQTTVVVLVVGGLGYNVWSWVATNQRRARTDVVIAALRAEAGKVDPAAILKPPSEAEQRVDSRLVFASEAERIASVDASFERVEAEVGGVVALWAKLARAGAAYDNADYDRAAALYEEVRVKALAGVQDELRGRAMDGLVLAREAKGDLGGALEAASFLENAAIPGFGELARLHRARILLAQGKLDEAEPLVRKLREDVDRAARERLPSALTPEQQRMLMQGGVPGLAAINLELSALEQQLPKPPVDPSKVDMDALREALELNLGTPGGELPPGLALPDAGSPAPDVGAPAPDAPPLELPALPAPSAGAPE